MKNKTPEDVIAFLGSAETVVTDSYPIPSAWKKCTRFSWSVKFDHEVSTQFYLNYKQFHQYKK